MTDLVPRTEIEDIVGRPRHARAHFGRAVSETQTFYILHSMDCLEFNEDLRRCPFSVALDRGLDMEVWERLQDKPVHVAIYNGRLEPARRIG